MISLIFFSVLLGGCAKTNESIIKEYIQKPRPFSLLLEREFDFNKTLYYELETKEERSTYLGNFTITSKIEEKSIGQRFLHPKVIKHWVHESGFSFPSGHTVNAFAMATLLGYIILYIFVDYRRKWMFVLPFLWAVMVAISRVAVGAHDWVDVATGSLLGTLFSLAIIRTGVLDLLLTSKKPN